MSIRRVFAPGGALALWGGVNIASRGRRLRNYPQIRALREAGMDRDVLDVVEREIDQAVRARFPGTAVRRAVLLQYGDDPGIEPGDLLVRVLLDEPDGPDDDWGPASYRYSSRPTSAAIGRFRGYPTGGVADSTTDAAQAVPRTAQAFQPGWIGGAASVAS